MTAPCLRRLACPNGDDCPEVRPTEKGDYLITGYRPGAERAAENEITIEVPGELFPELGRLTIPSITEWIKAHQTTDLIRIETLDRYDVASDDDDYHRYLRGEAAPLSPHREPWHERLRTERAAGKIRRRVWVGRTPLGSYPRYEMEWGFTANVAAGEDIRILDVSDVPAAAAVLQCGDFYVADRTHVARHLYDDGGRVAGSAAVGADGAAAYVALAEVAWRMAVPFTEWWTAHPRYHRAA